MRLSIAFARSIFIAIPNERQVKSFADDLITKRGVVSGRVALLLRSTETQPLLLDLENKSPPPKRSRVTRVTRRLPGEPPAPNLPGQPPAPNSPAQKCLLAATGHVDEKRNTHGSSDWLPEGPPRRSRRSSPSQQAKRSRVIHDPAAMCPRRPT